VSAGTLRHVAFGVVLCVGAFLRLWHLGYSNFQGDEVKALFPSGEDNLSAFLFDQRKGPLQFLVTFMVQLVDPQYSSEFLVRLPFALAAVASMWFFHRFVELHFGWDVALVATFLYATNGMIVGLSRIAQYQSLVLLFVCMALYFFSLAISDDRWRSKGVLLGSICWALGTLAHYDALLILPFVLYLVVEYYRKHRTLKPAVLPATLFAIAVAAFYIPFALSISDGTKDYWSDRLTGGHDKISSSTYLFGVYNPLLALLLYALFTGLGVAYLLYTLARRQPQLRDAFLVLWICGVVIFFEVVVNLPGTHIFNYLLPVMVLMGLGVRFLLDIARFPALRVALSTVLAGTGAFLVAQSYALFVDHKESYPWAPEHLFGRTVPPVKIDRYHTSLFGFPYDGGWRDIKTHLDEQPGDGNPSFLTNDKGSIAEFYMAGYDEDADDLGYYIHVRHPQSFNPRVPAGRIGAWVSTHRPDFVVRRDGVTIAELYDIPPQWRQSVSLEVGPS
jgi:4-amino-4-deoxy-L-arabinose transferase-like glycosyltransferase